MRGSSCSTMRGVNACDTRPRRRVCTGGSEDSIEGATSTSCSGRRPNDDHVALSFRIALQWSYPKTDHSPGGPICSGLKARPIS